MTHYLSAHPTGDTVRLPADWRVQVRETLLGCVGHLGELAEARRDVLGLIESWLAARPAGDTAQPDGDVTEQAARVLGEYDMDEAQIDFRNRPELGWAKFGKPRADEYRKRARALAAAGLLTTQPDTAEPACGVKARCGLALWCCERPAGHDGHHKQTVPFVREWRNRRQQTRARPPGTQPGQGGPVTSSENYVQRFMSRLSAKLPDCEPELLRSYAVLGLLFGACVACRDVHTAWAVWRNATQPEHPSIVPFEQLSLETQALDEPYVTAIQETWKEWRDELA